ncbi:hypothetical protein A6395_10235 [Exiguobacterium sp. SH31]|uniref:hypothetical protein n=1 Tax=Exiguobacterium sp. SH31 TaxID=1843183 RepID=UPI0008BA7EEC|nr:hypothetical protein [Exiguobacterium sp. SH31]OGX78800.1 hypothetical protein A6395_10235 [Exiguobacterium sp. SH31]
MDKRTQMRELMAIDDSGKWRVAFMTATLTFMLQFASENEWIPSILLVVVAVLTSIPALKKDWERENVKKRYLTSDDAKRLVHAHTYIGIMSYPLIIVLLYGFTMEMVTYRMFLIICLVGGILSWGGHRLYERHMITLDNNYVTEAELREERKWGSA